MLNPTTQIKTKKSDFVFKDITGILRVLVIPECKLDQELPNLGKALNPSRPRQRADFQTVLQNFHKYLITIYNY